jgi:hypothetical protein
MTLLVGCLCLLPVRLCLMLCLSVVTRTTNPAGLHRNGGEGSFQGGGGEDTPITQALEKHHEYVPNLTCIHI